MSEPAPIYPCAPVPDALPLVEFESNPAGTRRAVEQLLACDRRDDSKGVRRAIATLSQLMAKERG